MRHLAVVRASLIAASLLFLSQTAQAALFGDDEARRKIADLQQQVQSEKEATQATLSEIKKNQQALDQRLAAIEAAVKGQGLVDLLGQIDRLNQQIHQSLALQDLASGQVQLLSDGSQDESPSFAPNSRMLLYATNINGKGTLAAVSADGRVKQRLSETGGDVREPAWGPAAN